MVVGSGGSQISRGRILAETVFTKNKINKSLILRPMRPLVDRWIKWINLCGGFGSDHWACEKNLGIQGKVKLKTSMIS